jgi:hypothetical protein
MINSPHPSFECELPFSKQKLMFRPLTIRDEKILLLIDGDAKSKLNALKRVLCNCLLQPATFDFDNLPFVDFQYAFMFLRSISVDESIEMYVTKDDKEYKVNIKISDCKYRNFETFQKQSTIKLSKTEAISFSPPKVKNLEVNTITNGTVLDLIASCVDQIYNNDKVLDCTNFDQNQVNEIFESLPSKFLPKITALFENQPQIYFVVEVGDDDNKETVEVSEFNDFF